MTRISGGSESGSTAKPWFCDVISIAPLVRFFTGWLAASGCHSDMYDQPKHESLEASSVFDDGRSARPLEPGFVLTVEPGVYFIPALIDRWEAEGRCADHLDYAAIARKAIRPRGTLVFKSTYKGDLNVNFSSIVVDEISIVGSRCGPFEPALRLMESKQVDPTVLIDSVFGLRDALKAFERAAETGVLKVLVEP